jgi:nucleotide-binding universal stress UspA family protein
MFTRILVPIDLSDRNERTLRMAFALARQNQGSVTLVHVIQELAGAQDQELQTFYQRLLQTAESKLRQAARRFARGEVPVRTEVVIGDPSREIVRAASKHRASLVLMGSHRVDPRRAGRGWGTISYRVGILVACPVLLVK